MWPLARWSERARVPLTSGCRGGLLLEMDWVGNIRHRPITSTCLPEHRQARAGFQAELDVASIWERVKVFTVSLSNRKKGRRGACTNTVYIGQPSSEISTLLPSGSFIQLSAIAPGTLVLAVV